MVKAYKYEDIEIGTTEVFNVELTEDNMKKFCELSGDINPLHINKNFALEKGYQDKVVYGMLTSSYYSTLVGVYLPGERCLLHSVEIGFLSPVFVGDKLVIEGTVVEKHDIFNQLVIKACIKNQFGKKISKAKIKVGVLNE